MPPFHLLDFARASLDWLNHHPIGQAILITLILLLYAYLMVVTAKRYAVWSVRREMRQLSQERRLKAINEPYVIGPISRGVWTPLVKSQRRDYPKDAA